MAAEVKILVEVYDSYWMPKGGKTLYPISYPCTPQQEKVCTVLPARTTCDLKGRGLAGTGGEVCF